MGVVEQKPELWGKMLVSRRAGPGPDGAEPAVRWKVPMSRM